MWVIDSAYFYGFINQIHSPFFSFPVVESHIRQCHDDRARLYHVLSTNGTRQYHDWLFFKPTNKIHLLKRSLTVFCSFLHKSYFHKHNDKYKNYFWYKANHTTLSYPYYQIPATLVLTRSNIKKENNMKKIRKKIICIQCFLRHWSCKIICSLLQYLVLLFCSTVRSLASFTDKWNSKLSMVNYIW